MFFILFFKNYFALVVNQGDEVILFDPAYETYDTCIKLAGGVPVSFSDICWSYYKIGVFSALNYIIILFDPAFNCTGVCTPWSTFLETGFR